jgi:hypothetical protein
MRIADTLLARGSHRAQASSSLHCVRHAARAIEAVDGSQFRVVLDSVDRARAAKSLYIHHRLPGSRQCSSSAAQLAGLPIFPVAVDFVIVQPDRKTCVLEIAVLPSSLLTDKSSFAGTPLMPKQRPSKSRNAQQLRSRRLASTVLCASLMAGIACVPPTLTAQTTSLDLQSPIGVRTTSSLATRPAGIPLGSTEIATVGVSPVAPSQSAPMGACSGSNDARSSRAPFDGGGISETTSLSCADSRKISSPLTSPS